MFRLCDACKLIKHEVKYVVYLDQWLCLSCYMNWVYKQTHRDNV
jgi:hypothetical protein